MTNSLYKIQSVQLHQNRHREQASNSQESVEDGYAVGTVQRERISYPADLSPLLDGRLLIEYPLLVILTYRPRADCISH
jgi:hypothetical protein